MAGGKERCQWGLLQERVATGQEEHIPIADPQRVLADLVLVHAEADGLDLAAPTKLVHGAIAALGQIAEMARVLVAMLEGADIMGQKDIDPVEPEALKIVLKGPHHPVIAVIVDHVEGERLDHPERHRVSHGAGPQEAPDLVGEHIRRAPKHIAHHPLRPAEPIPGRGVEIADPGLARGGDQFGRLAIVQIHEVSAQGRAAEPELVNHQPRLAHLTLFHLAPIRCLCPASLGAGGPRAMGLCRGVGDERSAPEALGPGR